MRSLLTIAAVFLAAMATATPHLETIFTIPLPYAEDAKPQNLMNGDMLYVATTGGIAAANLTSKSIAWTTNVTNPAGMGAQASVPMLYHAGKLYAFTETDAVQVDAKTGAKGWHVPISGAGAINATFMGSKMALLQESTISIIDTTSGMLKDTLGYNGGYTVGLDEASNTIVYGIKSSSLTGKFTATNLWTNTEKWSYAVGPLPGSATPFYAFREYVLLTNSSHNFQDMNLIVLETAAGSVKLNLGAMNGVGFSGVTPTLNGNDLTVVAGEEAMRKLTIDLLNGYIIKQVPYSGGGGNQPGQGGTYSVTAADINAEIRITKSLKIEVGAIGGPFTEAASFSPSSGSYNLQYYGQGVVQIGNLQGWTMWQISMTTKKATFLARNEMVPGWKVSKGAPLTFNGDFIHVDSMSIKAEKIVF